MAKKYWWFQGDSVRELTRQLAEAGAFARLEIHPVGDGLKLFVIASGGVGADEGGGGGGINDSHTCPPSCP